MLRKKTEELFVEIKEYSILAAKALSYGSETVLMSAVECPAGDFASIKKFLHDFFGNGKGKYVKAYCNVNPISRFIRKTTLDSAMKTKDPTFINEILREDFNIDKERFEVKILNGVTGSELNPENNRSRDIVFCGALKEELEKCQDALLQLGIYPERMELGGMAMLGGFMADTTEIEVPTIILEMNGDNSQVFILYQKRFDLVRTIPYGVDDIIPLIQKELTLSDEASARKLLFSNTFDFTEKGPVLLDELFKELQALVDYYEVQTGQSVKGLFLGSLPGNLDWISRSLSQSIGLDQLKISYPRWLESRNIAIDQNVNVSSLDNRWFSLFSLINYDNILEEEGEE